MCEKQTLLITGVNGSIGSFLYDRFLYDTEIILLQRDVENEYIIPRIVNKKKRIVLLHFGSKTPANNKSSNIDYDINPLQLKKLINNINLQGICPDVIFSSSMNVYDRNKIQNIVTEESLLTKSDLYGASKVKCEEFLNKSYNINNIKGFISLRLPGVLAPNSAEASSNFMSILVKKLIANEYIDLYNPECYFNNIVTAQSIHEFILTQLAMKDLPCTSVNMASFPPVKLHQAIEYLVATIKSRSKISWSNNNNSFTIEIKKAIDLGFKPYSVFESLSKHIEYTM